MQQVLKPDVLPDNVSWRQAQRALSFEILAVWNVLGLARCVLVDL